MSGRGTGTTLIRILISGMARVGNGRSTTATGGPMTIGMN